LPSASSPVPEWRRGRRLPASIGPHAHCVRCPRRGAVRALGRPGSVIGPPRSPVRRRSPEGRAPTRPRGAPGRRPHGHTLPPLPTKSARRAMPLSIASLEAA
jgi:hypothetical protein